MESVGLVLGRHLPCYNLSLPRELGHCPEEGGLPSVKERESHKGISRGREQSLALRTFIFHHGEAKSNIMVNPCLLVKKQPTLFGSLGK